MFQVKETIKYDESINRWHVSKVSKSLFESPYETFEADVNLGEGYVQIVYPVRKAFLEQNDLSKVEYYTGDYQRVYFPFENNRVDFTTFINEPSHLWVFAKTYLDVQDSGIYPFELYTCGGVKIWVNKKEVCTFVPYTRNVPQKKIIELDLHEGLNEIAVYADELAERDVFFYFEIRYKWHKKIDGVISLEDESADILEAESFLKSCYFEKDCFTEGELILSYDPRLIDSDVELILSGDPTGEKLSNITANNTELKVIASHKKNTVSFGKLTSFNSGVFNIVISIEFANFCIGRNLLVGILPGETTPIKPENTLEGRKQQALEYISKYGDNVVNKCLAILEVNEEMTDIAYQSFQNSLLQIINKQDCADFYLAPMFILVTKYRHFLQDKDYKDIKQAILDFRYWIDEPGNDVMWYFSENHALLFHISQYLAGYLFQDEIFTVSQRKGLRQYEIGKKRLEEWFAAFLTYGYAEWNSATYIPIDLIGFFVLYQLAPDESIKNMAKESIDFTFKIISYNTFNGIMSSSYGRAYEDTLKAREQVEPSFIEWVSYGKGFISSRGRAVSLYCLSDYKPPKYNEEVQLDLNESMKVEFDQGISRVKTYSYRNCDYFMACVRRYRPFEHGHQQHLMNITLGKKSIQFYVNHPGERLFSGGNRPSYWAGNGTMPYIEQYKNTMLMIFNINKDELVHYIHTYNPIYMYDAVLIKNHWLFAKVDRAYLGVYFSNDIALTRSGANTNKEIISYGLNHGVILKCGSKEEYSSFEQFMKTLEDLDIYYDGKQYLSFVDPQHGEMVIKSLNEVYVGGKKILYEPKEDMEIVKEYF